MTIQASSIVKSRRCGNGCGCRWLILLMLALVSRGDDATQGRRELTTLLLNSYHYTYLWTKEFMDGFLSHPGTSPANAQVDPVSMDYLRAPDGVQQIRERVLTAIGNDQYDIVVGINTPALDTLAQHADELPAHVQYIFGGFYADSEALRAKLPRSTALWLEFPVEENIALGLKMYPKTKKVAVITHSNRTGKQIHRRLLAELPSDGPVEYVLLNGADTSTDEMLAVLYGMPQQSFVVIAAWHGSSDGDYGYYRNVYELMVRVSQGPVFSCSYIGCGLLGGVQVPAAEFGKRMAQLLDKVRLGTLAEQIVPELMPCTVRFDYDVLQRFPPAPGSIPESAEIVNRPKRFFEEYPHLVLVAVLALVALSAFFLMVGLFFISYLRLRQLKQSMSALANNLRTTLESIGEAVIVTDQHGCITIFNRKAELLTGFSRDEAVGAMQGQIYKTTAESRSVAEDEGGQDLGRHYVRLQQKDGSPRHIAENIAIIRDKEWRFLGKIVVFRDMTREYSYEERLRLSHSLMRKAAEMAGLGYCSVDLASETIIKASAELPCCWPEEAGRPVPAKRWLSAADYQHFHQAIARMREGRQHDCNLPFSSDYGGARRHYLFVAREVSEDNGNGHDGRTAFAVIQDVTQLRSADEEKRKTNLILDVILENLPALVFIRDVHDDYRNIRVNKMYCELHQASEEQLLGKNVFEQYPPEVARRQREMDESCRRAPGRVQQCIEELKFHGRDYVFNTQKIVVSSGERELLIGISFDITEQEQNRRDLLETSMMLQTLLDEIPVGVVVKDPANDFRYTRWNRRAEMDLGLSASEAVGRRCDEVPSLQSVAKALREEDELVFRDNINLTSQHSGEFNDQKRHFTIFKKMVYLAEGKRALLCVFVDVTQQKEDEQALRMAMVAAQSAERAKSYFLATMSHEIRTPLNTIIGFSELLQDKDLGAQERQDYVCSVNQAGCVLLNLINDILDLSKIEAEQLALTPQRTDLRALCTEILSVFRAQAEAKELALTLAYHPAADYYLLDQTHLRQILFNLLGNALKFTTRGGITLDVDYVAGARDLGELRLQVIDSGCGIPEDSQDKIFRPFVQLIHRLAKEATPNRQHGTGLGLAISQRLVEKMGGALSLSSVVDEGSTFTVTLRDVRRLEAPATADGANAVTDKPAVAAPTHNTAPAPRELNLLLVDDVPMNLQVLKSMLGRLGVKCQTAASGAEALSVLSEDHFDGVLTDLWMPEMSGADLSARIRQNPAFKQPLIIAVTADVEAEHNFYLEYFDDILHKPVTLAKLRELLGRLGDYHPGVPSE